MAAKGGKSKGPPRPRGFTIRPVGPKLLKLGRPAEVVGGPGTPPPGFLTGNNSASEWYVYWALLKIKGPPSYGTWDYQGNISGGGRFPGGSKPDFVILDQSPPLVLRIQTERFHLAVVTRKHAYDFEQRIAMERVGYRVIDLYEPLFLPDLTGGAVLYWVRRGLAGEQAPNPVPSGTTRARA